MPEGRAGDERADVTHLARGKPGEVDARSAAEEGFYDGARGNIPAGYSTGMPLTMILRRAGTGSICPPLISSKMI